MSKPVKYILFIGIPLIILLVVLKNQGVIGQEELTKVSTDSVEMLTITETVIASGKIQPEIEVKLSSEVSGEIVELPVVEGQKVEKGQLLVKINPDIYIAAVNRAKASVNSSRANVSSSKAQLVEAEKNYNRNKKLYDKKVISAAEFDAFQRAFDVAKLGVEGSEFQLESARATLNEAQDNLTRTTIYAPQSGTISMLNAELGERVVGTAQMTGTEIMRIANLEDMEVLVEVNENDIIRVGYMDTALIEVDAYLDEEFKGVVTEIANSANITNMSTDQVTNFEVKVRILKDSYDKLIGNDKISPFRPGMTASVEIETEKRGNILGVPIEAVSTRSDTSKTASRRGRRSSSDSDSDDDDFEVVFVYDDGAIDLQVVKTGIQDDENIEILEGLEEGQEVVTGPYSYVSKKAVDGDQVEVKDKKDDKQGKKDKKKDDDAEKEDDETGDEE